MDELAKGVLDVMDERVQDAIEEIAASQKRSISGRSVWGSKGKSNNNSSGHTVPNDAPRSNARPKPAENR